MSNCSLAVLCSTCTSDTSCLWCDINKVCVSLSQIEFCEGTGIVGAESCGASYYSVILVALSAAVLCICCVGCWVKRNHQRRGMYGSHLGEPLLDAEVGAGSLWRNSLFDYGEKYWMCVICGFDNKPRVQHCVLCGTEADFSASYKAEKREYRKEKRRQMSVQKEIAGHAAADAPFTPIKMDSRGEDEIDSGLRQSLTPQQRFAAFNYRRLNNLSLRQKVSRRRRMWQRVADPQSGVLTWVRRDFASAVGRDSTDSSDLGTSRPSLLSSLYTSLFGRRSSAAGAVHGGEEDVNRRIIDSERGAEDDDDEYVPPRNVPSSALAIAPSRSSFSRAAGSASSSRDSDSSQLSSSPGFTSVLREDGSLLWERVESGKAANISKISHNTILYGGDNASSSGAGSSNPLLAAQDVNPALAFASLDDLEAVAAMGFKDKQQWFLRMVRRLQKSWTAGLLRVEVRRDRLLDDSFEFFDALKGGDLHKWMRVAFKGEPGIDAGGLEREWFEQLALQIFDPQRGLFSSTSAEASAGQVHINPLSSRILESHRLLPYYRFVGRFLGKALMEQQAVPAFLALPLRKQILSLPNLEFVDEELFRHLKWLQHSGKDVVDGLSLDFTVTYTAAHGPAAPPLVCELVPNGSNVPLTSENKGEYLQLKFKHRMMDAFKPQLESLMKGFFEIIPPEIISVFDYQELELLMCGLVDIDVNDWRRHTEYLGDYARRGESHPVIKWFWQCVSSFSGEERVRLLQFATGCSRVPAQGFKNLMSNDGRYRQFNIQSVRKSESMYPRAHTCFNKLDLPMYSSQAELDAYLSMVVSMEGGGMVGFTIE